MRAAEGGEKVVERDAVGSVQHGYVQAYGDAFDFEEMIVACGEVDERARGDADGVAVIVFCAVGRDADARGSEGSCGAVADGVGGCGDFSAAVQAHLRLLVGGELERVKVGGYGVRQGEAAVVTPGAGDVWLMVAGEVLRELIASLRGLLELLAVVEANRTNRKITSSACAITRRRSTGVSRGLSSDVIARNEGIAARIKSRTGTPIKIVCSGGKHRRSP